MSYRPLISELITELRQVQDKHGDLAVMGYDSEGGRDLPSFDVEYNDDDGPVCLLVLSADDDD